MIIKTVDKLDHDAKERKGYITAMMTTKATLPSYESISYKEK